MRDASKSVARGPAIDVRVQNFLWLFPLGFLGHAVLWIHRRGGMDFALRLDRELWSPGSFMLPEWNLLLNWVLWFGLAVYLPFSRHKRSTAVALAVLTVTHFFHLDSAVPNHYLLIVVPAVLVAVCPFRSSGSTPVLVTLLRLLVTLTYAFAALHKLNPVHFSNRSPAGRLVRPLLDNLGIEELAWLGIVAATLSFAAEVLIPVCLHRKRWRAFGFYLGIVFHGTIAGLGAADYSLVICALYPVFLDKDESRSLSRLLRAASPRRIGAALIAALVGTYVCCFPLNPWRRQRATASRPLAGPRPARTLTNSPRDTSSCTSDGPLISCRDRAPAAVTVAREPTAASSQPKGCAPTRVPGKPGQGGQDAVM